MRALYAVLVAWPAMAAVVMAQPGYHSDPTAGLPATVCVGTAPGEIYVDADAGLDTELCGAPDQPCATIAHAWRDGGTVCLSGIAEESDLTPGRGGLEAIRIEPQTGHQEREWQYPASPARLVGWDRDGDGERPPVDADDVAVLDGTGLGRAFRLDRSYVEIAALTIRDYGEGAGCGDTGVWKWERPVEVITGRPPITHHWYHDLRIENINPDPCGGSNESVANLFSNSVMLHWVAWSNIDLYDIDDWGFRGAGHDDPTAADEGPIRLQNVTYRMKGCNYSSCGDIASLTFWKTWALLSGVEIIDNVIDGQADLWEPKRAGGPAGTAGVGLTPCSRGVVIRGNEWLDIRAGVVLQPEPDPCVHRSIADIVIEQNSMRTAHPWGNGAGMLLTLQQPGVVEGIVIRDNTVQVVAPGTHERAILLDLASLATQPGDVLIENNTIIGMRRCIDWIKLGPMITLTDNHCAAIDQALRVTVGLERLAQSSGNTYVGGLGASLPGWTQDDTEPCNEFLQCGMQGACASPRCVVPEPPPPPCDPSLACGDRGACPAPDCVTETEPDPEIPVCDYTTQDLHWDGTGWLCVQETGVPGPEGPIGAAGPAIESVAITMPLGHGVVVVVTMTCEVDGTELVCASTPEGIDCELQNGAMVCTSIGG